MNEKRFKEIEKMLINEISSKNLDLNNAGEIIDYMMLTKTYQSLTKEVEKAVFFMIVGSVAMFQHKPNITVVEINPAVTNSLN